LVTIATSTIITLAVLFSRDAPLDSRMFIVCMVAIGASLGLYRHGVNYFMNKLKPTKSQQMTDLISAALKRDLRTCSTPQSLTTSHLTHCVRPLKLRKAKQR
jgi:hypothetical protein